MSTSTFLAGSYLNCWMFYNSVSIPCTQWLIFHACKVAIFAYASTCAVLLSLFSARLIHTYCTSGRIYIRFKEPCRYIYLIHVANSSLDQLIHSSTCELIHCCELRHDVFLYEIIKLKLWNIPGFITSTVTMPYTHV